MSKKSMTPRDSAIAHYQRAFEQLHGTMSEAELGGVSTSEIWAMGDQLLDMASDAAMDAYEEIEAETYSTASAFSSLEELLIS